MPNTPLYDYLTTKYPDFCSRSESERATIYSTEIAADPGMIVRNFFTLAPKKALIFFAPISYLGRDISYLIALIFALPGAFVLYRDKTMHATLFLLASPIILSMALNLVVYADPRHRHAVNILIMVLGAVGLCAMYRLLSNKLIQRSSGISEGSTQIV